MHGKMMCQHEMFPNTYGTLVTPTGAFEVRGRRCDDFQEIATQHARLFTAMEALSEGKWLFLSADYWLKPIVLPPLLGSTDGGATWAPVSPTERLQAILDRSTPEMRADAAVTPDCVADALAKEIDYLSPHVVREG